MKAVKRPIPIEVEEFQPDKTPWPLGVKASVNAGEYFVWNELHASRINIKPGDFVNVTVASDVYPIDRETFDRTYDVVK
jgi:hypothetical protein